MYRLALLLLLAGCAGEEVLLPPAEHPVEYVDPFIGSGGFGYQHGSCFPGAAAPNGLAKVGPDSRGPFDLARFLHYSGYYYGDNLIQGFSHLHLHGTGATDYGVLTLMPSDGFDAGRTMPRGYESPFSKDSEAAAPGYYAVTLLRGSIRVEITATEHAAHHRYAFSGPARHVILDLDHHLDSGRVERAEVRASAAERRLVGSLRSIGGMSGGYGGYDVFFVIRSRTPWQSQLVWRAGEAPRPGDAVAGQGVGLALAFTGEPAVELQVGLSLVSIEQAAANLEAELPGWDLGATRRRTEAAWDQLLQAVRVTGGTEAERRTFYSALYHGYLMPSIHSDADGSYRGHDGMVRRAEGFRFVSDLSLWDTYRTLHPLYMLLSPDRARDAVRSLLEMARQTGRFPKWPLAGGDSGTMNGAPAELVLADAYLKGLRDFDAQEAYERLRRAAMDPDAPPASRGGRSDVEPYLRLGYVPAGTGASVSQTTEYARGDFALGQWARALGREDDARLLLSRSLGYRKLYDPGTGFLRPRRADGTLPHDRFDPLCFCPDYTEANAWHSLWMPSYDVEGLAQLAGGPERLLARLSEFFDKGQEDYEASDPKSLAAGAGPRPYYWHGNQPDIHAAYLFPLLGRPDLARRWVRWIMTHWYSDTPDGLAGNDDGGTLSAWYVFSALGLYPHIGTDAYVLGVPLFPRAEVRVPGGTFTIAAPGVSAERYQVEAVELDGTRIDGPLLRHGEIRAGRTLRFIIR